MDTLIEKVALEESGRDLDLDDLMEFFEEETEACDLCGGELVFAGGLGNTSHFRCRNCGVWVAQDEEAA